MVLWQIWELFSCWFSSNFYDLIIICCLSPFFIGSSLFVILPLYPSLWPQEHKIRVGREKPVRINCSPLPIPLSELPPHLLKKVVTKLRPENYAYIQRSCKDMSDFIRRDKNMEFHDNLDIDLDCGQCGKPQIEIVTPYSRHGRSIEIQSIYGFRCRTIEIWQGIFETWNLSNTGIFFEILKESRIKTDALRIFDSRRGTDFIEGLTMEQCAQLYEILKPRKLYLNSHESMGYRALFSAKTVKSVDIKVKAEKALDVLSQLFPTFNDIEIYVEITRETNAQRVLSTFSSILNYLQSNNLPKLHSFRFFQMWESVNTFDEKDIRAVFSRYALHLAPSTDDSEDPSDPADPSDPEPLTFFINDIGPRKLQCKIRFTEKPLAFTTIWGKIIAPPCDD